VGDRRERSFSPTLEQTIGKPVNIPDLEVPEKTTRRKLPAAYKLRALHEAERCRQSGESRALLCREGLYS
jgi:hypothetical protein